MAMKGAYTALMHSKFFTPAFNSAIFDGPVRIYFAQAHEAFALKIYFNLQQRYANELSRAKELHNFINRTVLIMLYPNAETFQNSFEVPDAFVAKDHLMDDTVIGVKGPFDEEHLDQILQQVLVAFQNWEMHSDSRPPEMSL
jgi:hypothetical protein